MEEETKRMIQEYVPGKQVTMAHVIASPDHNLYTKLGLQDNQGDALGIMTITPSEAAIIAVDIATKSGNVEIGFIGLLGLSGISNDCRDIEEAASSGNSRAQLALDVFAHKIIHYIGAYAADLNGLDTLVFTAGVGEHSARVRKMVCDSLTYLGVKIDESKNQDNALSLESADSKVKVMVIPTDEEVIIARDVMRVARLAK